MSSGKEEFCNECQGVCKARSYKSFAKDQYHWIMKYDRLERDQRENEKPSVCDFCQKQVELSFCCEPFCAEVLGIHVPFWMCRACIQESADNT